MSRRLLIAGLVVSAAINLVAIFTLGAFWHAESRGRERNPGKFAVSSPQFAVRNPQSAVPGPQFQELGLQSLKDQFQLTDAQLDTIRALHEFRGQNLKPVRDRLDSLQTEMLTLLQAPKLEQARIDSLLQQVVAAQDSLETGALGILLRLRNALTPEQRTRLPELFGALQQAGQQPQGGQQPPAGVGGQGSVGQQPSGGPPLGVPSPGNAPVSGPTGPGSGRAGNPVPSGGPPPGKR